MPKFACRQCRKEVKLDSQGVSNHLDGSPSCIPVVGNRPMPNWDRHEVVEDESTLAQEAPDDTNNNAVVLHFRKGVSSQNEIVEDEATLKGEEVKE
jgi:hypothetical protein